MLQEGQQLSRDEDYEGAIAAYNQAIKLDPDNADIYHSQGIALVWSGDYEGAIAAYNQAIALDSTDAWVYNSRGNAYYMQGKYEQAIDDYTQAITLDSDYHWAYFNRANAYFLSDDYEAAWQDAQQGAKLDPQDGNNHAQSCLYGALSDTFAQQDEILAACEQAINLLPANADEFAGRRGVARARVGDLAGAAADFATYVQWLEQNRTDETRIHRAVPHLAERTASRHQPD